MAQIFLSVTAWIKVYPQTGSDYPIGTVGVRLGARGKKRYLYWTKGKMRGQTKNHYVLQLNNNNLSVVDGPNDPMVVLIIKMKFA